MKDGDFNATEFPGTTAGLQAAIDYLAGGKGKVFIGPGTLEITTAISIHGGCHLQGSGVGSTTIKRASGSLTSGDAAYTGCSLFVTPFGSNGSPPTGTGNAQSDITISDMTLDGNSSAFGAVNPSTPRHMALYAFWTSRLALKSVHVKQFLQNGVYTDACRYSSISKCVFENCGQYAPLSSKNSITISNTQASSIGDGYSTGFTVSDVISIDPGDHHLDIANHNNVSVENMVAIGGFVVLELEGDTSRTTHMHGFSYSNVISENNQNQFFSCNVDSGVHVSDLVISNCTMRGHPTLHNTQAIVLSKVGSPHIKRFSVSNSSFMNINSRDADALGLIDIKSDSASISSDVVITGCSFSGGAPSSTRTNCHGLEVQTNIKSLVVSSCTFSTVAGVGVFVHPSTSQNVSDCIFSFLVVDTSNNDGFQFVENGLTNGSIDNVAVIGCSTFNACRQTGNSSFRVGALSASGGGSVTRVSFVGCNSFKSSGSNPARGLDIGVGAGSTTDNISCYGCNFNNMAAPFNLTSGSPTNCHFVTARGRGTNITAAATISVPIDGDIFHVTGNTNITNGITVNPWDNGRTVTLIFEGTPTVSDTGTSKLAGNFVAAGTTNDYDTLTLACDGTNWYEMCRSAN
jgi:hypothetical protein